MGVSNSPDISRKRGKKIFHGFEFIQVYIECLLIITRIDWSNHLEKLELTLQYLKDNGFKFNIKNSFFEKTKMEYLGLWVNQTGFRPINKSTINSKYDSIKEQ